jgi:hypothetical protein
MGHSLKLKWETQMPDRLSIKPPDFPSDRLPGRPLGKRALHPRLVGLRSSVVISLSMLVLSTAVWGAVYLLNSATLR